MLRAYPTLPSRPIHRDAGYHEPSQVLPPRVTLNTHAVESMTDLRLVTAVTIDPGSSIDTANERMKQRGVRLLLVVDDARKLYGVITAVDVLGERPVQVIQSRGVRRHDVLVQDVMTPVDQLEVLQIEDVRAAKVGHVVASLKASGRQHALVVDDGKGGRQMIRGIFSTSEIARQLGVTINTTEVARTFAEIEASLAR